MGRDKRRQVLQKLQAKEGKWTKGSKIAEEVGGREAHTYSSLGRLARDGVVEVRGEGSNKQFKLKGQ